MALYRDAFKTATREQDEDERLSEQVLDIDQALGELADEYEARRGDSSTCPPFEEVAGISGRARRATCSPRAASTALFHARDRNAQRLKPSSAAHTPTNPINKPGPPSVTSAPAATGPIAASAA
jgi:hypothetical protein